MAPVPFVRRIVVFLVVMASPAAARVPPTPEDAEAMAKYRFGLGTQSYAQGAYERAIKEFETAYELFPSPGFLFNIAQAHRMNGDRKEAVRFYQLYIAVEPNGQPAAEARAHIEILGKHVAAEEVTKSNLMLPDLRVLPPALPPSPPRSPPVWDRWWLWTTLAVVATGVGVGVDLGLRARDGKL